MTQLRECNDHLCHQPQLAAGGVRGGEHLSGHRQPSDKASFYLYYVFQFEFTAKRFGDPNRNSSVANRLNLSADFVSSSFLDCL